MMQYALKIVLSTAILVAVAELAKRSSFWAAALASLPLTSLLAFVWLYLDSGDIDKSGNAFSWYFLAGFTIAGAIHRFAAVASWRSRVLVKLGCGMFFYRRRLFRHGQNFGGIS